MKTRGLMILVFCSLPLIAFCAEVTGGSKLAGYRYFIGYRPFEPKTLEEFPAHIRAKVIEHLTARLGEDFFSGLSFVGGQVVDVEAVYRANQRAITAHPDIYSYDVHFQFTRPELGIQKYEAQIKFRKDGSVFEEIDLPAFRRSPEKFRLLPYSKIIELAGAARFPTPVERAELGYSREHDEIFWRLWHKLPDDKSGARRLLVEFSAHDGKVLRTFESRSSQ